MWELPQYNGRVAKSAPSVRLRHSITNTDFEILACLEREKEPEQSKPKVEAGPETEQSSAKWVNIRRLNSLPLTGLTRKILQRFSLLN